MSHNGTLGGVGALAKKRKDSGALAKLEDKELARFLEEKSAFRSTKKLSLDDLLIISKNHPEITNLNRDFNPDYAVSYRTWLALADFVAHENPSLLNRLFEDVEFKNMGFDGRDFSFRSDVLREMDVNTRKKYSHLKLNPRLYGSVDTRLTFFDNFVESVKERTGGVLEGNGFKVDSEVVGFLAGKNMRVMPETAALKAAFSGNFKRLAQGPVAKAFAKLVGVNPGKILAKAMPRGNAALNRFLDTRVIAYGPDYFDARVEYFPGTIIPQRADPYTLGAITAVSEAIAVYEGIHIEAILTPFCEDFEKLKAQMQVPGVTYSYDNYTCDPNSRFFLYRFNLNEKAVLLKRIGRSFVDVGRAIFNLKTKVGSGNLGGDADFIALETQETLDAAIQDSYNSKIEAAEARASEAEARANEAEAKHETLRIRAELEKSITEVNARYHKSKDEIEAQRSFAQEVGHDIGRDSGVVHRLGNELLDELLGFEKTKERNYSDLANLRNHEIDLVRRVASILSLNRTARELPKKLMSQDRKLSTTNVNYKDMFNGVLGDIKILLKGEFDISNINYNLFVEDDVEVKVNDGDFRTALINLVKNSSEAISEKGGGEINIYVNHERVGDGEYKVITRMNQSYAIPQDIAYKLSRGESVGSSKGDKGNGFGSIASYNIIKQHGGDIQYVPDNLLNETNISWVVDGYVEESDEMDASLVLDDSLFDELDF